MAKFVLEVGEHVVRREPVGVTGEGGVRAGELILTDRRVVLQTERGDSRNVLAMLFGFLGGVVSALASPMHVSHQIRREDFASVERTGKLTVKVRSTGEGYAMTWFEFSTRKAEAWADQLHRWA